MPEQGTEKDRQRQRHLYLLFDDWESGFSIHRVSLPRTSEKRKRADEQPLLPEPLPRAFMHVRALRGYPDMFTSAFGTKIMVMHPGMADGKPGIPMIDVQKRALTYGPQPRGTNPCPIFFPVGDDRLFVLDFGTLDCYLRMPPEQHSEEPEWGSLDLPCPPFDRVDVSSYGVQPTGRILVGTTNRRETCTFVFDANKTKEECAWEQYGNWVFPFADRGHYDTTMKGFVGLSEDGYLCCSTMAAANTGTAKTLHPPPGIRRTKHRVCDKNPAAVGQSVTATLVHMRQGKFCIVESVPIDNERNDAEPTKSWLEEAVLPPGTNRWDFVGGGPQCGRFVYRLKTFSLSYDTEGDLKLKDCKVLSLQPAS